ncbi:MAG: hypothetical protein IT440_06480 [Phycisphaeraceae bacterium]|nr:hypothetical protein [Phycisphaeraceae bacterium]
MNRISQYGWAITLSITVLGWVWVAASDRSVALERIRELEIKLQSTQHRGDQTAGALAEYQITLAQIRTDVGWIRQELRRLAKSDHQE